MLLDFIERLRTLRILVVEDDEISNMMLMHVLEREHEVFATREAESADFMLRNQSFDLVLLDIALPGMNGLELAESLKQRDPKCSTPIVAVSGLDGEEIVDRAHKSGFSAFIRKPYTLNSLKDVLSTYSAAPAVLHSTEGFRVYQ